MSDPMGYAVVVASTRAIDRIIGRCALQVALHQLHDGECLIPTEGSETPETHYASEELDALIPYTSTEMKARQAKPCLAAVWDNDSMSWNDPRDLAAMKDAKWDDIKAARSAAIVSPIMQTPYGPLDADVIGTENIKSQVLILQQAAELGQMPATIRWTMADNSIVTLTPLQFAEIAVLVGQRGSEAHEKSRQIRALIYAPETNTIEKVKAISWDTFQMVKP